MKKLLNIWIVLAVLGYAGNCYALMPTEPKIYTFQGATVIYEYLGPKQRVMSDMQILSCDSKAHSISLARSRTEGKTLKTLTFKATTGDSFSILDINGKETGVMQIGTLDSSTCAGTLSLRLPPK